MDIKTCNIMIGGEAGQGLVTIGELLSKILVRSGYSIVVTQSYQSRIRGGHNTFSIRTSTDSIEAPQERVDLLLALDEETAVIPGEEMSEDGLMVMDGPPDASDKRFLRVPYKDLSGVRFRNTAALGIACSILGLNKKTAATLLEHTIGKKHPEQMKGNLDALMNSFKWASGRKARLRKLPPPKGGGGRIMMNGNQAIAVGSVSAGTRFCSFYPMTPSTSIPLTLIGMAERMGLVVEQAEDEISAINMAIGASFAGAPSMIATSGGGFALMVEGISLAGMTETPLVIVVAQRPGPATGLPTRTEQADLEFVMHAGHGEFPRAIFSPGTVEECFHLTRKAFELSENFQGPVFILTDQFLADSFRAVNPFDIENLNSVVPGADPPSVKLPYLRHAVTESGVSPRLIPGKSKHLVVTDSDEHTEDGHLTEDLDMRKRQVEKRLRKGRRLLDEVIPPEFNGDDEIDLLLVSWGSSKGSAREAASRLRDQGEKVATLHFCQVWPLVPDHFLAHLERAKRISCIEGNATGQLAGIIRRETGFEIRDRISRYDGLPITPEYILRGLGK